MHFQGPTMYQRFCKKDFMMFLLRLLAILVVLATSKGTGVSSPTMKLMVRVGLHSRK